MQGNLFESRLDPIESAKAVLEQAESLNPYAKVLMFSGGKDSQAAYEMCQILGVKLDAILHVNTGCGLPETTEYVREFVETTGLHYIEADSGAAYENYVRRKGFFGVGTGRNSAHSFAFHVCKRTAYKRELANFRDRKRGRNILLINGARLSESDNRDSNMRGKYIKSDSYKNGKPASPNYWVSPLLDWSDADRSTFLAEQKCPINPVSKAICRSGECMCGTTQGSMARLEASAYSPRWGGGLTL
jgi:3'-phosphoadenosine 5'-phosphosulfate sulfotransferase (PAPS reductase)/FAD synthetase